MRRELNIGLIIEDGAYLYIVSTNFRGHIDLYNLLKYEVTDDHLVPGQEIKISLQQGDYILSVNKGSTTIFIRID